MAEICLDLQDRGGHDVVLVLFGLWLGERGIVLDEDLARRALRAAASYRGEVVRPLRAVRRRLKARLARPEGPDAPESSHPGLAAALREGIKGLELQAERLQILTLAALVEDRPAGAPPSPALGIANLDRLLVPSAEDRQRIAALEEALASRA